MTRNESNLDRTLRAIIGAVLVIAWAVGWLSGVWAVVLGIIGLVLLLTGIVGFCPAYRLLGISTCPAPSKP